MNKPKYKPDTPKRIPFTNFYYVRVYPDSEDVWVKGKGVFFLSRRSGKPRKKKEVKNV